MQYTCSYSLCSEIRESLLAQPWTTAPVTRDLEQQRQLHELAIIVYVPFHFPFHCFIPYFSPAIRDTRTALALHVW